MAGRRFGSLFEWVALAAVAVGVARSAAADDDAPEDPAVQPAQFVRPAGQSAPNPGTAAAPTGTVPDPPSPTVRVQVRVPATVAAAKDLPYRITVTNTSQADAYRVVVRNPIPEGVTQVVLEKTEPKPDKADPKPGGPPPKELVWRVGTLHPGEQKVIELVLRPAADAKEVRNQAYVSFEHGEAVTTRIDRPKLSVRKSTPKQAVTNDTIPVRIEITNPGKVPVAGVKLVEDVTRGFEFAADGEAEKGATPQQRVWQIGTLRPGERKVIDYKLAAKSAGELLTTSNVTAESVPEPERAEGTTKVLAPSLSLDLKGPPTVAAGDAGTYEVKVANTGTLPLTDVRVTAAVPDECGVTKMTNGGRQYRDQLVWTVPDKKDGPLKPGESYTLRFGLKASTTGSRTVRVAADAKPGLEQSREVVSAFQGSAVLTWKAIADVSTVRVGRDGLLTVRVQNGGGEPARNVRLRVSVPAEAKVIEASPNRFQAAAGEVAFDAVTIPAQGSETFTVTFSGERPGQAYFRLKLAADVLGDQPLGKELEVQVTGTR